LENLEKFCRTNGLSAAVAVDNKKLITSSVRVGKNNKSSNMWGHYCDKTNHNTINCKAIMRAKQHKKAKSEAKLFQERRLWPSYLEISMTLKSC
jgi:hypothetical protein